jgi:2-oxoglutarate ferredoxin oxidoreductase subunit alpha
MEKVQFPEYDPKAHKLPKPWATTGKTSEREPNVVTSLHLQTEDMEKINLRLQEKYRKIEGNEVRYEAIQTEDAEYILVAYGLSARIAQRVLEIARQQGIKLGLLRPISLYPYPYDVLNKLADKAKGMFVLEMNAGQMVEDVRLAVNGKVPVGFYGRMGGIIPMPEETFIELNKFIQKLSGTKPAERLVKEKV